MKPVRFNYLYFGIIFLFLTLLPTYNLYLVDSFTGSRPFFLIFTFGQACFEISVFIFCGWLIEKFFYRKIFLAYIGLTFLIFTTHLLDFILNRAMELSFWSTLDLVFDENLDNFIEMLHASNIPLWVWFLGFGIVGVIPLVGILFYKFTEKLSLKFQLTIPQDHFVAGFFMIPLALFIWDYSASRIIKADAYYAYLKTLPFKSTFLDPKKMLLTILHPPKKARNEKILQERIESKDLAPLSKPNIYLFVIESLRDDFITTENTPHIHDFKKDNIHFDLSISNANGTQISWFSIFYSDYPHYWAEYQNSTLGSPSLQILKKMGYKIHVHSSACLAYYGMDNRLFGSKQYLLDSYEKLTHRYPVEAHETDAKTIEILNTALEDEKNQQGQVFILFWDSTHFDYSWPKEEKPYRFEPVAEEKDYFRPSYNPQNISLLKNSYKNALYYIDSLFLKFIAHLKEKNLLENSIIVVTGDHGEEFYEHKRLFHASHLCHIQTNVPIYFKFPKNPIPPEQKIVSHMDIFPSIFDYLLEKNHFEDVLKGESIFNKNKWPYVMSARYNMSRAPFEFFLHNGKNKALFRFKNQKSIFTSKQLEILKVTDFHDELLFQPHEDVEKFVIDEFGEAIHKIIGF